MQKNGLVIIKNNELDLFVLSAVRYYRGKCKLQNVYHMIPTLFKYKEINMEG